MFRKRNSQALAFVCVVAMLITWNATSAYARVIANNLSANSVAVYYFNSQTNSYVTDYSTNGLTGGLFNNAQISTVSGRKCLSLGTNAANFQAWDDNDSLSVNKEFSIVAWVKISQQQNNFLISVLAYNGPIANISDNVEAGAEGSVYVAIDGNNTFRAGYVYDDHTSGVGIETTGRNVNNNTWHHVGFVINNTSMKLYLNGTRIHKSSVSTHRSFKGSGTIISIGEGARGKVDDVGFFRNDFTDAQVKLIYDVGLEKIISIASVDPNDKVATTWGALKKR